MNSRLPEPFLNRMADLLGHEYKDFLSSYSNPRTNGMRINSQKISPEDFLKRPETASFELVPVPWARDGFYYNYLARAGQHPWHAAGVYYLQEPSAMAVVEYLDPRPGEIILDLSAAPGGKSTQISARLGGQGILWANEIHPGRARILASNLERWGSLNTVISNETPDRLANRFPLFFDRILVDAPCSGEGMFRKDPQAIDEWSPELVLACANRQKHILDSAAAMLKPGGRLVYSTCTFSKEENEQVITGFLEKHPDFTPVNLPPLDPSFVSCPEIPGAVRLYPHRIQGEGHFIAVLERKGENKGSEKGSDFFSVYQSFAKKRGKDKIKGDKNPAPSAGQLNLFHDFVRDTLSFPFSSDPKEYILFGEHLYLSPLPELNLNQLSIIRPGLYLGTIKPGRFQPGLGLALSLNPEHCREYLSFKADDPMLNSYLRGETLPSPGPDGWVLVGVDQFPLGWAKRAQGILKNHYPKELRVR